MQDVGDVGLVKDALVLQSSFSVEHHPNPLSIAVGYHQTPRHSSFAYMKKPASSMLGCFCPSHQAQVKIYHLRKVLVVDRLLRRR